MKGVDPAAQISATRRAIRQTNFSDSITHGPRMKAGRAPPMVTLPTLSGFGFTRKKNESGKQEKRKRKSPFCFLRSCVPGYFSSSKIVNRKGRIQRQEKKQGKQVHLEKIERTRVGQKIQERCRLRSVQEIAVIRARDQIDRDRDHKVKLRPGERAPDGIEMRAESARHHQKNNADHDAGMPDEETHEANIGKRIVQVWRDDRLHRAADSPKISDLEPALAAG